MKIEHYMMAKAWMKQDRATKEEAAETWNKLETEFNEERKQMLASIGVFKMPGTNYYVIEPNQFQDWFNEWVKSQ